MIAARIVVTALVAYLLGQAINSEYTQFAKMLQAVAPFER